MDKQEARSLLTQHLRVYRERTYANLAAAVGNEEHVEVQGPSGQSYQVEVSVFWDSDPGGPVRVLASIDDGGLRAFVPLSDSFIKARDGKFIGEDAAGLS